MSLKDKMDDKEVIADEVAGDDDDEAAITLVRYMSISNAKASEESDIQLQTSGGESDPLLNTRVQDDSDEKPSSPCIQDNGGGGKSDANGNETKPTSQNNRYTVGGNRPARISMQEEPFNKSRVPRKSVLKHYSRPIARAPSTYDTTSPSSPPSSPSVNSSTGSDGTKSPTQQQQHRQPQDKPCCVVM